MMWAEICQPAVIPAMERQKKRWADSGESAARATCPCACGRWEIKGRDKRGSPVSGISGSEGASQIIRLSRLSSSVSSTECHMRDKIQMIPTNKGSLQGRRGWNIFEEWYCLTPPPLSLPPSSPRSLTLTHTSSLSPLHAPQPSSALPPAGVVGKDVHVIKDGKIIQNKYACPRCEFVHVRTFSVNTGD